VRDRARESRADVVRWDDAPDLVDRGEDLLRLGAVRARFLFRACERVFEVLERLLDAIALRRDGRRDGEATDEATVEVGKKRTNARRRRARAADGRVASSHLHELAREILDEHDGGRHRRDVTDVRARGGVARRRRASDPSNDATGEANRRAAAAAARPLHFRKVPRGAGGN
jgi:hypothetical protein